MSGEPSMEPRLVTTGHGNTVRVTILFDHGSRNFTPDEGLRFAAKLIAACERARAYQDLPPCR